MLEALFQECNNKWAQVKNSKKHAFRFFTLATIASDGSPHLRTVVLRDFNPKDISFTMYTDSRSQKLQELEQDFADFVNHNNGLSEYLSLEQESELKSILNTQDKNLIPISLQ